MKTQLIVACCVVFVLHNMAHGFFLQDVEKKGSRTKAEPAFSVGDVPYFHRFSNDAGDLHEYTPEEQRDLDRFTDMLTINLYQTATDGDGLAKIANSVLENYKANKARVIGTTSVPRTKEMPAEHLIVVLFKRPTFTEATFARFRMHEGIGTGIIYSHRIYGEKASEEIAAWVKKNGPTTEKHLMKWDAMPQFPTPK